MNRLLEVPKARRRVPWSPMRGLGGTLLTVCVLSAGALVPPAAAQRPSQPPPPAEANDRCTEDQDPTPVILVHGTLANRFNNFPNFSPQLEQAGYCVWALNYGSCDELGVCGTGRIQDSARQLRRFVERRVLEQSDSGKVSIIGHSQGALMPRYYIKFLGGRSVVEDMIGIAGTNHGTNNPLVEPGGEIFDCPACFQQEPYMGKFTRQVNKGDETPGKLDYTQIETRFDQTVIPYFSAFLTDDPDLEYNGRITRRMNGPRTTNFCLQDQYPSTDNHETSAGSPFTFEVVLDALRTDGPASPPPKADSVCARLGGDPGGPRSGNGGGSNPGDSEFRPACTKTGGPRNDVINGTSGNDVICAGEGNDVIRGQGGHDLIYAGPGNDVVRGDSGSDRLFGEGGNDGLNTTDGVQRNDAADGGSGNNTCAGDSGDRLSACG